jgi:glucose-1-phosphate thymidylyltransferase
MKGIVLAGGLGSRLYPATVSINKQLLPVVDRPLIYFPITNLILLGIKEILIIAMRPHLDSYKTLLGDGSQWGVRFQYEIQDSPNGISEALIIAENFLAGSKSCLALGDNIFYGTGLVSGIKRGIEKLNGALVLSHEVDDPRRFGVLAFGADGEVEAIVEKPSSPPSSKVVTGMYFFDGSASERAKKLVPSARGELEITDLLGAYLSEKRLSVSHLGRGCCWFDTGTPEALLDASNFVRMIESKNKQRIGVPEEAAYESGAIGETQLAKLINAMPACEYRSYLEYVYGKR